MSLDVRHIAVYLPSLHGGGAERVMVTLANGFATRGHRVDLVLARAEGPYLREVSSEVRVVDLNRGRVLTSLVPLVRYMRRERPDAMLAALTHANIVAILARKLACVPMRLVVSERSSMVGLAANSRAWLFRALMRFSYPFADRVVSVSRDGAKDLVNDLGLSSGLVTSIPNPVPLDQISNLAAQRPNHPWLKPGGPPVILAAGRLVPAKDYPTLLRAFALLRRQREARLIILGEGSLRSELEHRISELGLGEDVALPGFQPNPFGWMAACDLYVMSSAWEGFPNSLVQALACGAKVVSTDCRTGPAEILENGKWGRLVSVGDDVALAAAMAAAMQECSDHDAKARVDQFRSDRIIDQYKSVLQSIIGR